MPRPKGSKNKDMIPLEDKCKELGVDPFEILLLFASGDWERLGYQSEMQTVYSGNNHNEEFTIQPGIRSRAAAEACQYIYSKRKAVEHSMDDKSTDAISCLFKMMNDK